MKPATITTKTCHSEFVDLYQHKYANEDGTVTFEFHNSKYVSADWLLNEGVKALEDRNIPYDLSYITDETGQRHTRYVRYGSDGVKRESISVECERCGPVSALAEL